jgi:prenyltransferase beta subunit
MPPDKPLERTGKDRHNRGDTQVHNEQEASEMANILSRRQWIWRSASGAIAVHAGQTRAHAQAPTGPRLARETFDFIAHCRRADGGYAPSPEAAYSGESDTKYSDLAAVTYAAVLARSLGWELRRREQSVAFIRKHQRPDGRFVNLAGQHDPKSDLAVLYNTTQGVVGLKALDAKPEIDPTPAIEPLLAGDAYKKLPGYTTSFFPLFCAALGKPFPREWRDRLARHMEENQAVDGYLGDHVASTFHMAHFFRLIGEPVPHAREMVARVLRDQRPDGGWNIKEPDWDVHACFDAVFILRQLGGDDPRVKEAIDRGANWSLGCRNPDGGFGHFPGRHSDMDAVYFQLGTLIQAGRVAGVRRGLPDAQTLGWGHAMEPGVKYVSHLRL